jgi:ribose transport system ATP-binding protein
MAKSFCLESSAFSDGGMLPKKYTIDGKSISPPLKWSNPPERTKSFALLMTDSDIPPQFPGFFVHWMVYNIPSSVSSLDDGASPVGKLPAGVKEIPNQYGAFGMADMAKGYGAPWPIGEAPHRYVFTLYALKVEKLGIGTGADYTAFQKAILPETIMATTLVGKYGPAEKPFPGL